MLLSLIKNLYAKSKQIDNNQFPAKSILYSTPIDYYITKLKFYQPIDQSLLYKKLSKYSIKLLQYLLGAFNHWGLNTIFKSFRELREEANMSKHALYKALEVLEPLGLVTREAKSYKNKSHWTISITKFWAFGLRTFSKKVNQLLEVIFLKNTKTANSYSSNSPCINNYNNKLEIIAHDKDICSFFELKCRIAKVIPGFIENMKAVYLERRDERISRIADKHARCFPWELKRPDLEISKAQVIPSTPIEPPKESFEDIWWRESDFVPRISMARRSYSEITLDLVPDWLKPIANKIMEIYGELA